MRVCEPLFAYIAPVCFGRLKSLISEKLPVFQAIQTGQDLQKQGDFCQKCLLRITVRSGTCRWLESGIYLPPPHFSPRSGSHSSKSLIFLQLFRNQVVHPLTHKSKTDTITIGNNRPLSLLIPRKCSHKRFEMPDWHLKRIVKQKKDFDMEKKNEIIVVEDGTVTEVSTATVSTLIHIIRGKQVLLDNDLAMLYQVETGALNRAVKRNKERFPEDFCFRLTKEEFLRCQIGTSNDEDAVGRGGRRYMPYAFTEQGISMLSAVLRSDVAVRVSIGIMRAFVEMRRFLATNSLILSRIDELEVKQLEYQKSTDERFDKVFRYIENHAESEQKVFFDGQIYDAFSLITSIIGKAQKNIILVDGYVDIDTLNVLAKKRHGVNVTIYTYASAQLTKKDISNFNAQYPTLTVKKTQVFHDRFLILDGEKAYHIGASLKDAGRKCFGISLLEDPNIVTDLLNRLKSV